MRLRLPVETATRLPSVRGPRLTQPALPTSGLGEQLRPAGYRGLVCLTSPSMAMALERRRLAASCSAKATQRECWVEKEQT
jgi:hypothetical protein